MPTNNQIDDIFEAIFWKHPFDKVCFVPRKMQLSSINVFGLKPNSALPPYYGKSLACIYGSNILRQIRSWVVMIFLFGFIVPGTNHCGHSGLLPG